MASLWRRARQWQQTRGRRAVSAAYLRGAGVEIGALHCPLALPEGARVRYVDRMDEAGLRREYPELSAQPLVPVEVIDDGEKLATFADGTLDFIIASHMLEHCENPLGTLRAHLGKLRPGGVIYYGVPNKRKSFDEARPLTPFVHLVEDDREGPEGSRRGHYEEFARLVLHLDQEAARAEARRMAVAKYSIHFHVWDVPGFRDFLEQANAYLGKVFEVAHFGPNVSEIIAVLRKV